MLSNKYAPLLLVATLFTGAHAAEPRVNQISPSKQHASVSILKLDKTPYENGYLHGSLLKEEVQQNVTYMMNVTHTMFSPEQLRNAWDVLSVYIPSRYKEELRGLADGSDLPLDLLQQMHTLPEVGENLTCSVYSVLDDVTPDDSTFHVRLLDYSLDFEIQQHPVILIYDTEENSYANFTWAGFVGSIGGVNDKGLAIGEIGEGRRGESEYEIMEGYPFMFYFRDILRTAGNIEDALDIVRDVRRTNQYVFVFSDGEGAAVARTDSQHFETSRAGERRTDFNHRWTNYPGIPHIAYFLHYPDKASLLRNPEITLEDILANNKLFAKDDNLQAWVFRHNTNEVWLANAHGKDGRAADQPYIHLDLDDYFK